MLEETSSYNISRINKEIANQDSNALLIDVIQNSFIVGEEYTREEVKKKIGRASCRERVSTPV